ncbi:MAG: DNA polymerase/3'-5' exonuclease PolX [Endomicrobia bacterium]|nr:DNA polymerase/3'-5' exonuclease PolX [Endomicrobiia bacterium]MCX7940920.1 DNA polymerase/3'-5' exonuclease PolX [Endomicrobiia bacterium]MDW8055680.1 DNA polymerase/3'-5' exonuclease PolX [Elusimicrobiota bacterium]
MRNKEVAEQFYLIAQLLSLTDENPFKVRAYEKAAQVIESLPEAIEDLAKNFDKLSSIPGVGKSIAEKIVEYFETGKIKRLEELKSKFPEGIFDMLRIPGLGPKRVRLIYEKLGVKDIQTLKEYAQKGMLRNLPGFGEKVEQNIVEGIQLLSVSEQRLLLFDALKTVEEILKEIKKNKEVVNIDPCGSLRRRKETIGDIDILCCVVPGKEKYIIEKFTKLPMVKKVMASGDTKGSILTDSNIQVDLRVVPKEVYGAALQYFTGSKQHNIHLREIANKKGLTLSEYGVFKIGRKDKPICGRTEEEIYKILDLQYIEPELREDRGEIEYALKGELPKLLEMKDIKGDTHIHSKYSDGTNTIKEIVEYAEKLGYEWIIICDHSQSLKVAGGVSIKDLYKKIDEIRNINKTSKVKILCGQEVDITSDGKLDYPDDVLKELDFVIAAIHTGFKQSEEQITERIMRAIDNKYVHSISHPTGRLLNKRSPYRVNISKIIEYAGKNDVMLEINAFPERLDLDDVNSKYAKEHGVMLSIGTDAHHISQMEYLILGVYVARRGWLEKKDVVNTMSYSQLCKFLKKRR